MRIFFSQKGAKAFTLPEILIAVGIFSVISTISASLYVQSFRQTRRANLENQVYEDARYVLQLIADEVREGMIDYDEYYSQNVVLPLVSVPVGGPELGVDNFGQNYGRYYSSFYNPGTDQALGFDCNDGTRNARTCTPIRGTVDRNTGMNPYAGKPPSSTPGEDAFCGKVEYGTGDGSPAGCEANASVKAVLNRLYLINADASQKTILAREQIGLIPSVSVGTTGTPIYALSILRLKGFDTNRDGKFDSFICAPEFECRGADDVASSAVDRVTDTSCDSNERPRELPRRSENAYADLAEYTDSGDFAKESAPSSSANPGCDPADQAFYKDFIPLSPLRVNVSYLNFIITPAENPHYAFAEDAAQIQPRVTITLTVEPNPEMVGSTDSFTPVTLTETVSTRVLTPIPAPKLDI